MKKHVLLALVCILCVPAAFADWALRPQAGSKPVQWIDYALTFNGDFGIERNRALGSLGYSRLFEPFELSAAFQTSADAQCRNINDITLSAAWWAVKSVHQWRTWEFGIESIYHYQHYQDIYGEHDGIFYINMRQRRDNGFELVLKQGGTLKCANLYATDTSITNLNPVAWLSVAKTWQNGFELFSTVGSHSTFRYQLFFAPTFTVGAACTFGGMFRPSIEWIMGCTDFFSASIYINRMAVRFAGRILL